MWSSILKQVLKHPDEFYPLLKLMMVAKKAEKQIPAEPHWRFCYSMFHKVSGLSLPIAMQQLNRELRDTVCVFYLVLRALDTIEDDTSIDDDIKVRILITFHQHIRDRDWHFACGTKECKVLMDEFHHVTDAFLELKKGYQEAIKDVTMQMGAGMAKFICKEVETLEDYDEYCHYVAGLVGLGLSRIFHASGTEILFPDSLSNSMGVFLSKANIIRDYLEDINETPRPRTFWPRDIWSKYVHKLEDLKYEQNSEKAIQCLNDMVTNALIHIEDCFKYMSDLRDPAMFRFCAIPQIIGIGTLTLCYNNIHVYKGTMKMRRGLVAKVIDRTKTIGDVYQAFYDFSSMLKSKVDMHDPNAKTTITRIETVQKICKDSGTLSNRKSYIVNSESSNSPVLIALVFIIMATLCAYLFVW